MICFIQCKRQWLITRCGDDAGRGICFEVLTDHQTAGAAVHIIACIVPHTVRAAALAPCLAVDRNARNGVQPILCIRKSKHKVIAEVAFNRKACRRIRILYRRRLLGRLRWGSGRLGLRDLYGRGVDIVIADRCLCDFHRQLIVACSRNFNGQRERSVVLNGKL